MKTDLHLLCLLVIWSFGIGLFPSAVNAQSSAGSCSTTPNGCDQGQAYSECVAGTTAEAAKYGKFGRFSKCELRQQSGTYSGYRGLYQVDTYKDGYWSDFWTNGLWWFGQDKKCSVRPEETGWKGAAVPALTACAAMAAHTAARSMRSRLPGASSPLRAPLAPQMTIPRQLRPIPVRAEGMAAAPVRAMVVAMVVAMAAVTEVAVTEVAVTEVAALGRGRVTATATAIAPTRMAVAVRVRVREQARAATEGRRDLRQGASTRSPVRLFRLC